MLIKVNRGTRVMEGESLCDTCSRSRIIRGRKVDEELVYCDILPMQGVRITFKVTSCTEYMDGREPSYRELVEKAWILRPPTKRRTAGFVRAADLEPDDMMRLQCESLDDE